MNTNKIDFEIKDFDLKFDVFKICIKGTEVKYLPKRSKLIPPGLNSKLLSVFNYSSKCMYLLFYKDVTCLDDFMDSPDYIEVTMDKNLYQDTKLNLLLNSIAKLQDETIFNISGHFQQWVRDTKDKRIYLNYRFYNGILQQSIVTYTKVDNEKNMQIYYAKGKGLYEDYIESYDGLYIKKGNKKRKTRIGFINVNDVRSYQNTKVYFFSHVLNLINTYLKDTLVVKNLKEEFDVIKWKKPRNSHQKIIHLLNDIGLHIVNLCDEEIYVDQLMYLLTHSFTTKNINSNAISVGDEIDKDKINIRIIHNNDYYKEYQIEDKHISSADIAIQHITVEDMKGEYQDLCNKKSKSKHSCIGERMIFEGLIKYEVIHETFNLSDIENVNLQKEWKYYWKCDNKFYKLYFESNKPQYTCLAYNQLPDKIKKIKKTECYFIEKSDQTLIEIEDNLNYHPLPDFQIIESRLRECDSFGFIEKSKLIKLIESFAISYQEYYKNLQLQIFNEKIKDLLNNVNQIAEKDITRHQIIKSFPPDRKKPNIRRNLYQFIYESTGKRIDAELGKVDVISQYMGGHIHINYKEEYNNIYYTVGKISENDFVKNLSTTNQIKKLKNCTVEDFNIYSSMLCVDFVRVNQMTSYPFLFKYLREYAYMSKQK